MNGGYVLYGGPGTGAVAVEAALRIAGAPYQLVDLADAAALAKAAATRAMGQAPVLTFPGGETLTESAAILMRLAELHPQARLAPGVDDPRRGAYLRWMSFVSAAIYAHYWVKDDPARLVADPAAHGEIDRRIEDRILEAWRFMGSTSTSPWSRVSGRGGSASTPPRRALRRWSSGWTPTRAFRPSGPNAIRSSRAGRPRPPRAALPG
jgi:glutathione S-transferase